MTKFIAFLFIFSLGFGSGIFLGPALNMDNDIPVVLEADGTTTAQGEVTKNFSILNHSAFEFELDETGRRIFVMSKQHLEKGDYTKIKIRPFRMLKYNGRAIQLYEEVE